MILIPAIDLKQGHCVRLRQGNMDDSTEFSEDPLAMAGNWVDQGCVRLHIVDLDGAFEGEPINADVIEEISKSYPKLEIQIGGGIRSIETVEAYIEAGVNYADLLHIGPDYWDLFGPVLRPYRNRLVLAAHWGGRSALRSRLLSAHLCQHPF